MLYEWSTTTATALTAGPSTVALNLLTPQSINIDTFYSSKVVDNLPRTQSELILSLFCAYSVLILYLFCAYLPRGITHVNQQLSPHSD